MEFTKHIYPNKYIPMIAIVTAAGTGAVITHEEKKIKAGLLGAHADAAYLDSTYTFSLSMM